MADKKWSDPSISDAVSVGDSDYTIIVQGGASIRAAMSLIRAITASKISDSTTVGRNVLTASNPSAVRFFRINADNSVSLLDASTFLTAIGGQASGSYLVVGNNLSDLGSASTARTNLGGTTVGQNIFTLTNPSAVRFVRINADNTVTARTAAELLSDISAQASDQDLTDIAALSPSNDDIVQRKAGAWTNRTMSQLKTDLSLTKSDVGLGNVDNTSDATKNAASVTLTNKTVALGSNTISGSVAEFNAALTGADFYTSGGTDVPLADGGTGASLADPGADRIMFWDESGNTVEWLQVGTGLSITGTTLEATGGGGGGIGSVVEDTSPQLGGNLDLNGSTVGDATAADLTKLHALTATDTELNYVDGVTSAIQTQLDAKVASGGALGTPSSGTLTNCTGLPVAGIQSSTSTALGVGSLELGHASDTTLSRASAGVLAVEGTAVLLNGGALGTPSSGTLTNCTGLPQAGVTGLTTADSPQFTGINLGHASDTTISRVSAGVIAVEGVTIATTTGTREKLTANRTYYVRTDGSDSNTGLTNSSGGAFLTWQKAVDVVWDTIDIAGYTCTIKAGNTGTWTAGVTKYGKAVGGIPVLEGDTTTPSNVLISVTGGQCFDFRRGAVVEVKGFKVATTTSGYAFHASSGATILLTDKMDFGACATGHLTGNHADFGISGDYTISGNAPVHFQVTNNSAFQVIPSTITLSGTPAFSTAFAAVYRGGAIQWAPGSVSGSGTGSRYSINSGGIIDGDLSILPGNAVGTNGMMPTVQSFTASGTYTPTSGMRYCKVMVQAPGGGGGGADSTAAIIGGGGGGGGEYAEGWFSAASIGASQTVTIGAVGSAGSNTGGNGGTGGTTSLGSLITAIGGTGGTGTGSDSASVAVRAGGAGGTGGTGGTLRIAGQAGSSTIYYYDGSADQRGGGSGGNSRLGAGARSVIPVSAADNAGVAGGSYGGGGSGANDNDTTGSAGGAGGGGIIYIEEYFN